MSARDAAAAVAHAPCAELGAADAKKVLAKERASAPARYPY
jgi:hypothetical protein